MSEKQLLQRKKKGDIVTVAAILGVTRDNASVILRRPDSKKYKNAINALRKVVEARESLIQEEKSN